MSSSLTNQHILSVDQFNQSIIQDLFSLTEQMKLYKQNKQIRSVLNGYVLGNLFFEASTRSRMSFTSAFLYLGGQVNHTTGVTFSSISKGETLEDTINVIQSYCDVIVLRHSDLGTAKKASQVSQVPVINAGDGIGEHPTQALLDLYTIFDEKKQLDNLTITMVGDLKHGRTVHSLARLLCLQKNIRFIFAAPQIVQMPEAIVSEIRSHGFQVELTDDFNAAISEADVIYSTRIQRERYENPSDYETFDGLFTLTKEKINHYCKPDVTVMHPLPRTNEIKLDVDALPGAAYFRQAANGLYVRMALFCSVLGKEING